MAAHLVPATFGSQREVAHRDRSRASDAGRALHPPARCRSPAGCQRRGGHGILTWRRSARSRRCWPSDLRSPFDPRASSSISRNAGTARARSAAPRRMRSRWRSDRPRRARRGAPAPARRRGVRGPRRARARPATRSTRRSPACLADEAPPDPRARARAVGLGRDARLRARSPVDARRRGDRRALSSDRPFRRPDLAVPVRPLDRRRRSWRARQRSDPAWTRRMSPRSGVRRSFTISDGPRFTLGSGRSPAALTPDEWEHVRLHPYQTERVLSRSEFLSTLAPVAERPPRAPRPFRLPPADPPAPSSAPPARLLAAADAYHAMTEPRPYRDALSGRAGRRRASPRGERRAARPRRGDRRRSRPPGNAAPRLERPAGLTEREAEVIAHAGARAADQAGRTRSRHLGQDRRPSHPERLPEDRRLDSRGGNPVRHGARARGMGRTPDCPAGGPLLASSLTLHAAKEETMTTRTPAAFLTDNYEIAEAIAPSWERRREDIEGVCTPIRDWMVTEVRPSEGRHSAGARRRRWRDRLPGRCCHRRAGPADHDRPFAGDGRRRPPPRCRARRDERRVQGHGRRTHRSRGRLGRRCAVPVRIHAHGGSHRRARRDPPRPAPGRAAGARKLGSPRAQPLLRAHRDEPRPARPHPAARAPACPGALQHGEPGTHDCAARRCRLQPRFAPRRSRCGSSCRTWTGT